MRTDAIIAWWRAQHAYPLTMVNANLRHYVADYDCRVTLPTLAEVDIVVRHVRKNWNRSITRHRNYVVKPKEDGYRAHHLVVSKRGYKIEIQVRTKRQDFWANTVEYDSRQVKVDLKSGYGPDDVREYYRAISDLFAHADTGTQPPADLGDRLLTLHRRVAPFLTGVSSEIKP